MTHNHLAGVQIEFKFEFMLSVGPRDVTKTKSMYSSVLGSVSRRNSDVAVFPNMESEESKKKSVLIGDMLADKQKIS